MSKTPRPENDHVPTRAPYTYDAQVDVLLERISTEKTFEAEMIRSILGPTRSLRSATP